jgi:hypothetical protein
VGGIDQAVAVDLQVEMAEEVAERTVALALVVVERVALVVVAVVERVVDDSVVVRYYFLLESPLLLLAEGLQVVEE